MEYYGAEDVFFWQGVKSGQMTPGLDLDERLDNLVSIKGKLATACSEAFLWGFELGLILTTLEYYGLTNPPECIKIKASKVNSASISPKKEEKKEENKSLEIIEELNEEYPIKGTC